MNDIDIQKQNLRKIFLAKRSSLNPAEIDILSKNIAQKFVQIIEENKLDIKNKTFGSYIPTKYEAKPVYIEEFLVKNNCQICYPKINFLTKTLDFIENDNRNIFLNNKIYPKILEPFGNKISKPDNILVPLLAFDKYSQRLGMGKGFYDRTLMQLKIENPKLNTFGIAFKIQQSNQALPISVQDYILDFVVSA